MKTIICGLSEDFEGGETSFPKLNITVKLLSGDVMSFDNVDEHNNILKSSYHAGLPVSSGDKWVMTKWLKVYNQVRQNGVFIAVNIHWQLADI